MGFDTLATMERIETTIEALKARGIAAECLQTKEEALANIREAIEGYIAALREDNLSVPDEPFDTLLVAV